MVEVVLVSPESAAALAQAMGVMGRAVLAAELGDGRLLLLLGCFDPACRTVLASIATRDVLQSLRGRAIIAVVEDARPVEGEAPIHAILSRLRAASGGGVQG